MESSYPPEMLIFICPRHEGGYTGHLLSLFQESVISAHRMLVARRLDIPPPRAFFVRTQLQTRPPPKNQPKATQKLRTHAGHGHMGTKLWDTPPAKHSPRRADPIVSRFSFQSPEFEFGHGCLLASRAV